VENRIWGDGNGICWCDNHDSWVTCTTSAECKIVITAVLMVMSSMDPHMIRWNLGWDGIGLVWLVG
jgi:hypothetical protein